jgi:hypothetical protein
MKNVFVFLIFFAASFFIGAAPILLVIGVIWLLACWQAKDGPDDGGSESYTPPPTPPTHHYTPPPQPPRYRRTRSSPRTRNTSPII